LILAKNMYKSISRRLDNCFDAHEYFPYNERYESFKLKKRYFLTGMDDDEIQLIFFEFVFFHFAVKNKIYPKLSKCEILNYYDERKSEIEIKNEGLEFFTRQIQ
jgi:hypothetical protein